MRMIGDSTSLRASLAVVPAFFAAPAGIIYLDHRLHIKLHIKLQSA
jgi:hypothetical protein